MHFTKSFLLSCASSRAAAGLARARRPARRRTRRRQARPSPNPQNRRPLRGKGADSASFGITASASFGEKRVVDPADKPIEGCIVIEMSEVLANDAKEPPSDSAGTLDLSLVLAEKPNSLKLAFDPKSKQYEHLGAEADGAASGDISNPRTRRRRAGIRGEGPRRRAGESDVADGGREGRRGRPPRFVELRRRGRLRHRQRVDGHARRALLLRRRRERSPFRLR